LPDPPAPSLVDSRVGDSPRRDRDSAPSSQLADDVMATPSAPFFARVATSSHRRRAPRARDVVIVVIGIFIGVPRCARITTADRRPRIVVDDDVDETDADAIARIADAADAIARASADRPTERAMRCDPSHPPPIPPTRARSVIEWTVDVRTC
jgi:hypothetical protein